MVWIISRRKRKCNRVLIGNKSDNIEERKVSYENDKQFVNERLEYFEGSAKLINILRKLFLHF